MERILSFETAKTLWIIQLTETRLQFIIQETILWRMRAAFSDLFALALTTTMESLSSGYLMNQNDSFGSLPLKLKNCKFDYPDTSKIL